MKVFIVLAVVIAATQAALDPAFREAAMAHVQEIGMKCAAQESASADDIAEIMDRKMPSRREGQCLIACFNEKMGVMDGAGKLDLAGGIASLAPIEAADAGIYGKMKQILETCIPSTPDTGDRCDTAVAFAKCGHQMSIDLGLQEDCVFM